MLTLLAAVALASPVQLPRDWIEPYSAAALALERRALEDSRRGFEAALAVLPTHGPSVYGLACVLALAGDTDAALERLELADALDPLEAGLLTWDVDLESLRGDSRFVALVERARRRAPQLANGAAWPLAWRQGGRIESCDRDANVAVVDASDEPGYAGLRSLVDLRTGETIAVLGGPTTSLFSAAVEPRGNVVALVEQEWWGDGMQVVLVDARTGEHRRDVLATDDEVELRFTTDGRLAVRETRGDEPGLVVGVVGPTTARPLSPIEPLAPLRPLGAARAGVRLDDPDFVLHADRRETATALTVPGSRGEVWIGTHGGSIVIVETKTGRERARLAVSTSPLVGLFADGLGESVLAVDESRSVHVIDVAERRSLAKFAAAWRTHEHAVLDRASPRPTGGAFAIELDEGLAIVERSAAGEWSKQLVPDAPHARLEAAAWTPDGSTLACAVTDGEPRLVLYDAARHTSSVASLELPAWPLALEYSPDGRTLWIATGSLRDDETRLHAIDVVSGEQRTSANLHRELSFDDPSDLVCSPDGSHVVLACSGLGVTGCLDTTSLELDWRSDGQRGGGPFSQYVALGSSGVKAVFWCPAYSSRACVRRISSGEETATLVELEGLGYLAISNLEFADRDSRVVGLGAHGVQCFDSDDGRLLWSRVESAASGHVLATLRGHVDAPLATLEQAHVLLPNGSLPLDALAAHLLDVKRVRAAADGVALHARRHVEAPTLTWSSDTWPNLREERVHRAQGRPIELILEARHASGISGFEVRTDGTTEFVAPTRTADGVALYERTFTPAELDPPLELRVRSVSTTGLLSRAVRVAFAP